jgi:hypothetical protein
MLRDSVSNDHSQPKKGLNLRDPAHELGSGEVTRLQNLYWDGFVRIAPGSRLLTPSYLILNRPVRGGIRFYPRDNSPKRLVAYDFTDLTISIAIVDDNGAQATLFLIDGGIPNVFFSVWSITNSVYWSDEQGNLFYYSGNDDSYAVMTGTNIPVSYGPLVPMLDRLLAITDNGIERTDARVDDVWSSNSSWATFRPEKPGRFVVLHPYSIKGTDTIYPGVLALQQSAFYHITGTDFGTDVTSSTASVGEDSAIKIIDSQVGTSSPKSIITIPGIGVLWFTSDKNIYWIPEGQLSGKFVADKLFSNNTTPGLESVNGAALDQVWMTYFDRKLILGVPMGSSLIPNVQFFLDLRTLSSAVDAPAPVWYGPMTMDTWSCVWREDQQGELQLMAGEGKAANGAYLYKAYQKDTASHFQGSTEVYPLCIYIDRHNGFERGQSSKSVQDFRLTAYTSGGQLRAGVLDLNSEAFYQQEVVGYSE